jgi:hypothetical protein
MKQYKFDTSYTFSSDLNLLYKLFLNGLPFEYVDTVVSVYEAEFGLSTNHVEVFKERKRIFGENLYSLRNMFILIDKKLRQFLRRCLPKNIVSFLVSRNLIRIAGKSKAYHLEEFKNE